jgi:hypothetical protein
MEHDDAGCKHAGCHCLISHRILMGEQPYPPEQSEIRKRSFIVTKWKDGKQHNMYLAVFFTDRVVFVRNDNQGIWGFFKTYGTNWASAIKLDSRTKSLLIQGEMPNPDELLSWDTENNFHLMYSEIKWILIEANWDVFSIANIEFHIYNLANQKTGNKEKQNVIKFTIPENDFADNGGYNQSYNSCISTLRLAVPDKL